MGPQEYLAAGTLAMLLGLDRVALLQSMACRPLVAATLTGWLLGSPFVGLQVGILLELLWLGRLPVGAAIPPDDTQVAVGTTVLALTVQHNLGLAGMPVVILAVLAAIPLGMVGQHCERWARHANGRLETRALAAAAAGADRRIECLHLAGLVHFAVAALATCTVIVAGGSLLLAVLAPLLVGAVQQAGLSLQYSFTLVGAAVLLGTLNVSRGYYLFGAAFSTTLLTLWLR
jgi:PTS system mannose-specific IIC component